MYYQTKWMNNREWLMVANDVGILFVGLASELEDKKLRSLVESQGQLEPYFNELKEYFNGERKHFNWPLIAQGTPFQQEVWAILQLIPYGSTQHYGQIAEQLGRPKAARAVAKAIGKNPHLIITPCHRVIGKDGSLTGFRAGLDLKQELLNLEER